MHQNLVPDLFVILVNNPLHAKNSFLKNILKKDYQKAFKKLTKFFLWKPYPFNEQHYEKEKGPGTSDQSLFRLQNKFRKIPLSVMYYLTKFEDGIYKPVFELFQNLHLPIYTSQFIT